MIVGVGPGNNLPDRVVGIACGIAHRIGLRLEQPGLIRVYDRISASHLLGRRHSVCVVSIQSNRPAKIRVLRYLIAAVVNKGFLGHNAANCGITDLDDVACVVVGE